MEQFLPYIYTQKYLLFLIGVMIVAGIMKDNNLLGDLFSGIYKYVKSKRALVFLTSFFGGILPIPGRVTVSAGILDSLAPNCSPDDKSCKRSRSKFGIIDYLSTHHYYLWSPLEKTVILPIAALNITWLTFMSYMWPLVLLTFTYIIFYIFWKFKESDIIINNKNLKEFRWSSFFIKSMPLFIAIGFLAFGFGGQYVFPILAAYYILLTKTASIRKVIGYINWWLVGLLFIILIISVFFKSHAKEIGLFINQHSTLFDVHTFIGFLSVSSIVFVAAWLMGSSGKYAGLVAILLSYYGIEYMVWFLTLEFMAYNLSPMHKCVHIGRMYFGTPVRKYFEAIIVWQVILISYAGIYTYLTV